MLMLRMERTLRSDPRPDDRLSRVSSIGHHVNFIQVVDQLIDPQEQEIPSRENTHGDEPGQSQAGRHPHLQFLGDGKLNQSVGRHLCECVTHCRSRDGDRLPEEDRPRVLRQKIHSPFELIKIFHLSP